MQIYLCVDEELFYMSYRNSKKFCLDASLLFWADKQCCTHDRTIFGPLA